MNGNQIYNQPPKMPMMQPPVPHPLSRREKMGRRLMSGKAMGISTLPDWFATYAVATYAVALVGVNLINSTYATEWYFWVFGIAWVAGFFFLSEKYSQEWSVTHLRKSKAFEKKLFTTGLVIRLVYAVFIYFFYINMNGRPYEFAAADSEGYVETAMWLVTAWNENRIMEVISYLAERSFSDLGYPLVILLPMRIFDVDFALLIIRVLNAFFGAYTSVIIYRIASRSIGESSARMAAIFCMLHPVLICYVGFTLKEIFMTWLLIFFVDAADRLIAGRSYTFRMILPVAVSGFGLFMFRTVLGMVAFLAVFFALVMIDSKIVSWGKKIIVGILMAGVIMFTMSDDIMREINEVRDTDVRSEQESTMVHRYGSEKGGGGGNKFANYAGAAVFAPMIFTIPFPTMVSAVDGQQDMRLIHGGNWMRNVMSGFVILAMFMLLLTGDWRRYTLPLAVLLGYIVVLIFSAFAHSLRFHVPVIPLEMLFAAYAITNMRKKHRNWYIIWCLFMVVACFGWNWMKLKGRGL